MTDARMVATNTHRRWRAVQSAAPRADRMTCSSHGLALGLIKTRRLPVQSLQLTILVERSFQLTIVPCSHTGERRQTSQCPDDLFRAPQFRGRDCLLGKRCLMKKVNRGRARISRDVFQTKVCNEIVFRCVRMIFGDAAKARGQLVLHVKTRIG